MELSQDKHIRRSGDDYAQAFAHLLPQGIAWPRESSSTLMQVVRGLSQYWGFVDGRAADLLERESDPRQTVELLPDWERAWGLPDPCFTEPLSIEERQRVLVQRMTLLGAQSRDFFREVASWLGYEITIREFAPFMVGVSRVGDTTAEGDGVYPRWEIGSEEMRFYWTITIDSVRLTWFRTGGGGGETGVDPHLRIGLATELECVFERWKPAHTQVIFDYSGVTEGVGDASHADNSGLIDFIF